MKTTKQTQLTEETAWPLIIAPVVLERALAEKKWRPLVGAYLGRGASQKQAEDLAKAASALHSFAHLVAGDASNPKPMYAAFSMALAYRKLRYLPANPRRLADKCKAMLAGATVFEVITLPRTGNKNAAKPHKGHTRPNRKRSPAPTDSGAGNLTD